MRPGVLGHRPGDSCALRGRLKADLATPYTSAVVFLVQFSARRSLLTSFKLRLKYTTQNAHTMPTGWLVLSGQRPLGSNIQTARELGARGNEQRLVTPPCND